MMQGEELYSIYVDVNAELGIEVQSWDELDEDDQQVWRNMAERMNDWRAS